MIRRPPRSTPLYSSAASDVYKRQVGAQRELLVDDHDAVVLAVPDLAELDRLALEGDLAVIGAVRVLPGENLHQGGLTRAVLPADRVDLPRADREGDVLQ